MINSKINVMNRKYLFYDTVFILSSIFSQLNSLVKSQHMLIISIFINNLRVSIIDEFNEHSKIK